MIDLSPEAQRVLEGLTSEQKRTIQRDNPFRNERDQLLYALRTRGVKLPVLAEISGLSENAVFCIAKRQHKDASKLPYSRPRRPNKLEAALKAISRAVYAVLNRGQGKEGR